MDIHNYKRRYERTLERIKEATDISEENKAYIFKFKDYCLSEGIGIARIERYLGESAKFSKMLGKSLPEANKEDIRRVIGDLESSPLSPESKKCFKIMVRKLYRVLRGIDEKGFYPPEVKWISIALPKNHKKMAEELLTESDILSMIQNADSSRDKAFISLLYESGCRIGEIGNMQIKNVSFEEKGARIVVNGKTGMRKILVIFSTSYLQNWINNHPQNDNPEAPLWIGQHSEALCYNRLSAILKQSAQKSGIKKRIYCHLTRHSKASSVASFMTEAMMKQYFGWGQDSKMCAVYIHMNGRDLDDTILRANGIEIPKEKTLQVLQSKTCLRCKKINEATARICNSCGLILDKELAQNIIQKEMERQEVDNKMALLLKADPRFIDKLIEKMKGIS
jgi:site-specific recombinase XerD